MKPTLKVRLDEAIKRAEDLKLYQISEAIKAAIAVINADKVNIMEENEILKSERVKIDNLVMKYFPQELTYVDIFQAIVAIAEKPQKESDINIELSKEEIKSIIMERDALREQLELFKNKEN